MTNRRFQLALCTLAALMALFCGACATMDSDGDRVETGSGLLHGVYVPPNVRQQAAYAQTPPASSYGQPMAATQTAASMPPAPSTAAASSAMPSDPGRPNSGNLANAQAVVAGMGAEFKRCYDRTLQDDPSVIGSATLVARIGPDGRVVSVSPSKVIGLPGNLVACLVICANSAQFAPPEAGGATVVIPLSLRSEPSR